MVVGVEFPRKLYFPRTIERSDSGERALYLQRSFRWKWRLLLRANAFLVEWWHRATWTSRIRNGSDEWTSEGTSFGVKCVFDGVVISPELFHRRLIGNVDERPLRFPAYRIPPLESRFVHVRVSSILFSLSLSPPFIRLLLIFFPPLFVEILFCFFRAWTQRNRYTRNGVWWFLILRGTVCDGNRRLWKEDTIRNTSKTTFHRHRAVRFSTILWIPYRKRLSNYRSSSNGRRNEEFRIVDSLSQLKPRSEIRSLFVTDALTQLPWPIYAFTWYYASVADDGQRCESIASVE